MIQINFQYLYGILISIICDCDTLNLISIICDCGILISIICDCSNLSRSLSTSLLWNCKDIKYIPKQNAVCKCTFIIVYAGPMSGSGMIICGRK